MRDRFVALLALLFSALSTGAQARELKVLTFNTWLLPVVSDNYLQRLARMPEELAGTGADLIVLQEVWRDQAKADLIQAMQMRGYPYAAFKPAESRDGKLPFAGYLDDGLLVISKFPISSGSVSSTSFSEYTRTDEYFAGKGALRVQVELPGGPADIYAAHLGAVSFEENTLAYNAEQMTIRFRQAQEVERFIRSTRRSAVSLLAIDTNAHPYVWDTRARRFDPSRVGDVYALFARLFGFGDATRNLYSAGIATFDLRRNRFAGKGMFAGAPSEFIDYIYMSRDQRRYGVGRSELAFTRPIGREGRRDVYLSDHFGVLARFPDLDARN